MAALSRTAPAPPRTNFEPTPGIPSFAKQTSSLYSSSTSTPSSTPPSAPTSSSTNSLPPITNLSIRPSGAALKLPAAPPAPPTGPASNARLNKMSMASVMSPEPTSPAASSSPAPLAKVSMTTKEWVVPPRPKPGRKPATDTPPTKRKAQNRAAQRAFRERRAARVGELEEQIEEQREERDKTERELREKIRTLELDLQSFRSKCSLLEKLLDRERQERNRSQVDTDSQQPRRDATYGTAHSQGTSLPGGPDGQQFAGNGNMSFNQPSQMQLTETPMGSSGRPQARQPTQAFPISQIISPPDPTQDLSEADLTCGNCQPNGPCACAEEAMRSVQGAGCGACGFGGSCECIEEALKGGVPSQQAKRASSPSAARPAEKRLKHAQPIPQIETDFTGFGRQEPSVSTPPSPHTEGQPGPDASPQLAPKDRCGFCDGGMYCVCAEAALRSNSLPTTQTASNSLQSVFSQETQAPSPPAEPDSMPTPVEVTSTGAVKLRRLQNGRKAAPAKSSCGPNGPGTCQQCLEDPQSGLFCRSLAAINNGGSGGCCGGRTAGGGCCKTKATGSDASKTRPIAISCADTYKTLSTHKGFDEAFEDLGTWLPKLKVLPLPEREPPAEGRPAVEIDAASIMSTLKYWDVRFGTSRD